MGIAQLRKKNKGAWKYHFFHNKTLEWWITRSIMDKNVKDIVIPMAIKDLVQNEYITEVEGLNLLNMINSSDSENFVVAISIIKNHKKKLYKQLRYGKGR